MKQYQMVAVKKLVKKINEVNVEYLQVDYQVVKQIIQAAVVSMQELTQIQEEDKRNKWEKVLKMLISDEKIKGEILDQISPKENNEN